MSKQSLINLVDQLIIDNNNNQITPAKVRSVLFEIINEMNVSGQSITANLPLVLEPFSGVLSIAMASSLVDGYLSKEDYAIFSNKNIIIFKKPLNTDKNTEEIGDIVQKVLGNTKFEGYYDGGDTSDINNYTLINSSEF